MISSRVLAAVIGAYALAVILVAPRVTYADSFAQASTQAVRFADLNLDTRSGVATLFRRIQSAAGEVCGGYSSPGTLLPSVAHRSCINFAVADAVHRVDAPLLTAYFGERDARHALNTVSR
jgi:UrcA family protein